MTPFSERNGFDPQEAEIVVRHEAPNWLRSFVIDQAYEVANLAPSDLRSYLCGILYEEPDQGNWSEFPNIDGEARGLIRSAQWYHVYDFIEWIYAKLSNKRDAQPVFCDNINRAFKTKGIGWQLQDGQIQIRGSEAFQDTIKETIELATLSNREMTTNELREALHDLSRKPQPDITGAIQHSMSALECLARSITNQPNLTLGDWIKKNRGEFPAPLDVALEKLWGYTSEQGRHNKEGKIPTFEEAELVVTLSSALSTYLLRRHSID